ncbi:hypothetical protein Taro_004351 [Colocasia esculenta]|uniref:Uncharacterized protein n=1 Tax=Colocasia esculenta TaxID=4460 RepID=A0A843TPT9_COLES|nr:hypothetical protein [Colocasia esculenta]
MKTPKHHGCLNTLHPNPSVEFTTCWGRVEELLVAGELWIDHKKVIFFPCSSATTSANRPLRVEQSLNLEPHPVQGTRFKPLVSRRDGATCFWESRPSSTMRFNSGPVNGLRGYARHLGVSALQNRGGRPRRVS